MRNLPVVSDMYTTMTTIAGNLDVIECYHSDLWHYDQRYVRQENPDVVLWGIGDCGTHLLDMSRPVTDKCKQVYDAMKSCYGHYKWYVINTRTGRVYPWKMVERDYFDLLSLACIKTR